MLLCSDGLSDMLLPEEIETLIQRERDPRRLSHLLIDAALEKGGYDNVTVVVIMRAPTPTDEQRALPVGMESSQGSRSNEGESTI